MSLYSARVRYEMMVQPCENSPSMWHLNCSPLSLPLEEKLPPSELPWKPIHLPESHVKHRLVEGPFFLPCMQQLPGMQSHPSWPDTLDLKVLHVKCINHVEARGIVTTPMLYSKQPPPPLPRIPFSCNMVKRLVQSRILGMSLSLTLTLMI